MCVCTVYCVCVDTVYGQRSNKIARNKTDKTNLRWCEKENIEIVLDYVYWHLAIELNYH